MLEGVHSGGNQADSPPSALRRVKALLQGPKHLNVLTQASFKFLELSLHAALNVKLILQVFSQDVTLTRPEMNQNAERALRRLLPFRLGGPRFPRARAASDPDWPDGPPPRAPLPRSATRRPRKPVRYGAAGAPRAVRVSGAPGPPASGPGTSHSAAQARGAPGARDAGRSAGKSGRVGGPARAGGGATLQAGTAGPAPCGDAGGRRTGLGGRGGKGSPPSGAPAPR